MYLQAFWLFLFIFQYEKNVHSIKNIFIFFLKFNLKKFIFTFNVDENLQIKFTTEHSQIDSNIREHYANKSINLKFRNEFPKTQSTVLCGIKVRKFMSDWKQLTVTAKKYIEKFRQNREISFGRNCRCKIHWQFYIYGRILKIFAKNQHFCMHTKKT